MFDLSRVLVAMSERSDELAYDRIENMRLSAVIVAAALLILDLTFEIPWLCYPRAAAWLAAGVFCVMQARVLQRLRLPATAQYLWAGLYALIAVITLM